MIPAPVPENEEGRMKALHALNILDTKPEPQFDEITKRAIKMFDVPISTITIIDNNREWFKSQQGLKETEAPRNISFCGHALTKKDIYIVEDTLENEIFKDNPHVKNGGIRFYAGKSLYDERSRLPVGVFCIKDYKPRKMNVVETSQFLELAAEAEKRINEGAV
ncbi:MAG: hypothetical protein M1459_02545 [Patescibacteria group bacterium]|nr:hypothetical protein [Patescibacteria group bacterium]